MKLHSKLTLLMIAMLVLMGVAMVSVGYVAINNIVYRVYNQQFERELSNINIEVSHAYRTLQDAGVLELESYVVASQERLVKRLSAYQFGQTGYLYILDTDGKVVWHRDYARGTNFPHFIESLPDGQQYGVLNIDMGEQAYFSVYHPAGQWGWVVALAISEDEIFSRRNDYLITVTLIGLLVLGIVLSVSAYLTRHTSARIQSMLEYIKGLKLGRKNGRVTDPAEDEFADEDEISVIEHGIESLMKEIAHQMEEHEQVEQNRLTMRKEKHSADVANQAKSNFLASMSHELRTPMHAILGFSEMGSKKVDHASREKLLHYFSRIQESGRRLLSLLNDLLDLSKLESGHMEMEMQLNNLVTITERCILELESSLDRKGLYYEIKSDVSDVKAELDEKRVGQVITNLLSNAIKYSPEGGRIIISIQEALLKGDDRDKSGLSLSIKDEGNGIPEGELDTIFDKFFQSKKNRSKEGGTGLGLAISKEIIEIHGGSILARNITKGGAEFVFTLPMSRSSPEAGMIS